mmetsp:Transcript_31079/g.54578  ORF Transcript_31079/g.54578 Transcript_31079/m.54578 type:complete len:205 (+) Transcript_31079:703-1317(+)
MEPRPPSSRSLTSTSGSLLSLSMSAFMSSASRAFALVSLGRIFLQKHILTLMTLSPAALSSLGRKIDLKRGWSSFIESIASPIRRKSWRSLYVLLSANKSTSSTTCPHPSSPASLYSRSRRCGTAITALLRTDATSSLHRNENKDAMEPRVALVENIRVRLGSCLAISSLNLQFFCELRTMFQISVRYFSRAEWSSIDRKKPRP